MKLFEPAIQHFFGGGVYAKQIEIPKDHGILQHVHKFDHLSVLAKGKVEVMVDDVVSTYTAPACIVITAGKQHGVYAVTDTVWYCIHATDCEDVDKVDEQLVVKR